MISYLRGFRRSLSRKRALDQDLEDEIRSQDADVDTNVAIDGIETMEQIVCAESRFRTGLPVVFALPALFVASLGLYGGMSDSVSQKTRESGIRMAIGGSRGAIVQLVLVRAAKLVAIGICAGLVGALLRARPIASLLYGITPFDILTLASGSLLLASVALAASCGPGVRGANANPMDSLRCE